MAQRAVPTVTDVATADARWIGTALSEWRWLLRAPETTDGQ